ncbi:MAG: hypothetical protein N3A61_09905, partial [Ignavibacteria bacterium]|nr:hypothetical protein [Ignavibacteria bacterium]
MNLDELREKFESAILKLENNVENIAIKYNNMLKENSELKQELNKQRNQNAELLKEKLERENELNNLKVQYDKIKNTIIISEKERQALKSRISELLERIE